MQNLLDENQVQMEELPPNMWDEDDHVESNMIFSDLINGNDDKSDNELEVDEVASAVTVIQPHGSPPKIYIKHTTSPRQRRINKPITATIAVASWHNDGPDEEPTLCPKSSSSTSVG